METQARDMYRTTLKSLVRRSATIASIERLKNDGNFNIPIIYPISNLLIVIGISLFIQVWWLFIPATVVYLLVDWKIRYNKVVKLIPVQLTYLIKGLLLHNAEELQEAIEDLEIKTKNNIYNKNDIKEKSIKIDFLTITNETLKEMQS